MFTRNATGQNPFGLIRKVLTRGSYTLRTGYWHSGERSCPDFPDEIFVSHSKVYSFASQFCAGKRILDVGCGTGYGTSFLSESADSAIGVDISRQALRYARKHYGNSKTEFLRMRSECLFLGDRRFDFVVSVENFEHLRDHRAGLRNMSRVLVDSGLLLLTTPNPEMFFGTSNPYHTHEFAYDELLQIIQEYFSECLICENLLTPTTEEGRRLREARHQRGAAGVDLTRHPWLWGNRVDTTYLCNTHSFICFARHPRRG